MYVCMYACVFVSVYVYMYVCLCIHVSQTAPNHCLQKLGQQSACKPKRKRAFHRRTQRKSECVKRASTHSHNV